MPIELQGIKGLTDLNSDQKFKIAIVGEQKVGKSWLALTMPGSIYHCDFDDRGESVKEFARVHKRTDIISKAYIDRTGTPNAVNELQTDLQAIEYLKKQGKEYPQTYILDSMTYLRMACERELMKQQSSLGRGIKVGTNTFNIPSGWDVINGNRAFLEYLIGWISSLGNLICIFHEQDETDRQRTTKDGKAYTGRKTVQPQYLSSILSTFNDVFRMSVDYKGERIVQVQPNNDFMASTSMKIDKEEKPNLADMIAKHKKNAGIS